jgi:hypothetical protein
MPQPRIALITCRECGAWYNSDRELLDHRRRAHRHFSPEQNSFQADGGADHTHDVEVGNRKNPPVT